MKAFNGFSVELTRVLSNEADLSRMIAFPGDKYKITSIDHFEDRSFHMSIKLDGSLASYARMTPGPNAIFHEWTAGQCTLPNDASTIDIGRVLVNPRFQGLSLSTWIMIECCLFAYQAGFKKINGTFIPEHTLMDHVLHGLGFENCGQPVIEQEAGGISVLVQPVTCTINPTTIGLWATKREKIIGEFYKEIAL